jgi:hypothetical protein
VLSEDGLPVGVVNDDQLEQGELEGYSLLILPTPNELTPAQQQTVAVFKARGGAVIENDPAWAWSDPAGTDAAAAAFRAVLETLQGTAPVQVTGGPPGRYAVSYRKPGRLLVAVTNDFGWVQFSTINNPIPEDEVNPTAPPAEDVHVTWRKSNGLPQPPGQQPHPHQPRAIEVISGTTLSVHEINGSYRVDLPTFPFMALLVVRGD